MGLEEIVDWGKLKKGAPQLGSCLEHYQIEKLISPANYGWVFLAQDLRLGRKVAIKVLSKEVEDKRKKQFHEEGERQAKLDIKHPGVVAVYAAEGHENYNYLVMEHIKGQTLRERLANRNLGLRRAAQMITPITNSLSFCHRNEIYHGDIKPSNIMEKKEDGQLVLIDFGSKLGLGEINHDRSEMEKTDL